MTATLLVEPAALAAPEVEVSGDAYRHLFRARRLAVGDPLRLVDGRGKARTGRVVSVDRRSARLAVGEPAPALEPALELELWVAAPRPERASWLVEKVTELGVVHLLWLDAERAVRHPGAGSLERHRRVARAAVEQCGRARLPTIEGPLPFSELETRCADGVPTVLCERAPGTAAPDAGGARLRLLVGPEGGWSDEERGRLAALGALSLDLGERILRVETAAVSAAALYLCRSV